VGIVLATFFSNGSREMATAVLPMSPATFSLGVVAAALRQACNFHHLANLGRATVSAGAASETEAGRIIPPDPD